MTRPSNKLLWTLLLPLLALLAPASQAACTNTLSTTSRNHGYGTASNAVSLTTGAACTWTVVNTNNWISFATPASGSGSFTNIYFVAANPNPAWRTGVVVIADQTFTVAQNPIPCSYPLSPATRTHGYDYTTGTVIVATSGGCPWTVTNTSSWIHILSGTNGVGSNTVTYTVNDNNSGGWRTGLVFIADQTYTVAQRPSPCLFELSPASRVLNQSAASGLIGVMATAGCGWTVNNPNSWITIGAGYSGTGDGSVFYTAASNPSGLGRTGVVLIADQQFTLTQLGQPCSYSISPASQAFGTGSGNGLVTVTATSGCSWPTVNTNSWITFSSPAYGTGNGSLAYSVAANLGSGIRTGVVVIAGQPFSVTQPGLGCSFKLSPTTRAHGYAAVSNSVSLTTSNTCPWDVVNTNNWITITSDTSGTGSNIISYAIDSNPSSEERVGVLLIGGQSLVLTQRAATCSFSIATTNVTHGFTAETGLVAVTAIGGCAWTVSNSNPWIVITSPTNATGSGNVTYTLYTNANAGSRSGTLLIAGQPFTITQFGMACGYKLSPTSRVHGFGAASNYVGVTASNGCSWSVVNTNDWISITTGLTGSGTAPVGYTVDPNPGTSERMGVLVIGGQSFMLTQRGVGCNVSVSPPTRNHGYGATSNSFTVSTGTNCAWNATTTNDWITIVLNPAGIGNGLVGYTVDSNPSGIPRSGAVLVGDQGLMISQAGRPCTYSILPTKGTHSAGLETGVVSVTAISGCAWNVTNSNDWITIQSGSNGLGNGAVIYAVAANPTVNSRTGMVMIADDTFTVTQAGLPTACTYRLSPNNRTNGYGAVADSFNLITDNGCPWTIVNNNDWVTITSPASGTSSTTVSYAVEPNPNLDDRMGVILVGGQPFMLTQRGLFCSYSLSATTRTHGFSAATNSINVSAGIGCAWTVNNTNPWITIVSGASGTGPGSFLYTVPGNFSLAPRTGVVTVADQTLTMVQRMTNNFVIETIAMQSLGQSKLKLSGVPAGVWRLQGSSNLVDWVNLASITNITGVVECIDSATTNTRLRFYRAVQP